MDKIICQIWIMIFGCSSIWLVGRLEDWKRWGYILGLVGQPAWFYTTITHEQYGIAVLSCWYTYSWGQGVYNYWIKKPKIIVMPHCTCKGFDKIANTAYQPICQRCGLPNERLKKEGLCS